MIRNAQAYGLAFRMHDPARQLLGALENEGIAAGRGCLEQSVLGIIDPCKVCNLGKVAHHQRQMVAIIDLANLANAIQRFLVAEMAANGIAGIGRQSDDRAITNKLSCLNQQALLWRFRVNMNDTRHDQATSRQTGFKSSGNGGALPRST